MNMFVPMTKIDEDKRLVYGIATQEVPDRSGETMDYDSSKPNFEKWSQGIEKASGGKSLGNLREMHTNKAAGKLTQINFNDESKAIEVCAKVVDEDSWNKVKEGVLTGFSIGGSYAKRWHEANTTRFTADPAEVSLVDYPCVPTATFDVIKANGLTEQRQFRNKEDDKVEEVNKSVLADFNKALEAKDLNKAFSFQEITERLQGALNSQITTPFNCGYFYIKKTYPDCVIIKGTRDGDGDEDLYRVEYTMDEQGVITLGNISEVRVEFVPTTDEDNPKQLFGLTQKAAGNDGLTKAKTPSERGKTDKRPDVTPADKERAEGEYGDVNYADETNKKYPLDSEKHVRAAASYFGMPKNREKYSADDQKKIDSNIAAAKKKFGIGEEVKKDDSMAEAAKSASVKDLAKAGAAHSKATLDHLTKMAHDLNQMGAVCKCDKCMKMYGSTANTDFKDTENATKSAKDDLHKNAEADKSEALAKAMEGFTALQKTVESLEASNKALLEKVTELENQPMPGGPLYGGSATVSKGFAGDGLQNPAGSEENDLMKAYEIIEKSSADPQMQRSANLEKAVLKMKGALNLK